MGPDSLLTYLRQILREARSVVLHAGGVETGPVGLLTYLRRTLRHAGSLALLIMAPLAAAASDTPLLDYAARLSFATMPYEAELRQQLARVSREIERHPPPETDCARTLGAARFAHLFEELGAARSGVGDYEGAAEAFTRALDCHPRAAYLHAQLTEELLHLGRYEQARSVVQRGLTIEPEDATLRSLLARLDFVEERWSDAIENFRAAITLTENDELATYWQCFLWLAQRRAGEAAPKPANRLPAEGWPRPILEMLQGKETQQALLEAIENETDLEIQREMLSEALYYVGQQHLAEGRLELARRYLAATVNLKVLYYIEHHMALAELAKPRMQAVGQQQHDD